MLEWQSRHLQWFDFFIQGKGPKPVPAMTSPFDYQDDLRAIQDKSIENRKGFGRPASGVRKPGDSGVDDDLDLSKRACGSADDCRHDVSFARVAASRRSEEHTSELQSLMRISYAVFCLNKNNPQHIHSNSIELTHLH